MAAAEARGISSPPLLKRLGELGLEWGPASPAVEGVSQVGESRGGVQPDRGAGSLPTRHPHAVRRTETYFLEAFSVLAILIAATPSWSPLSLSWQVRVTLSPAFTFFRLAIALSRTGAVMLLP